MFKELQIKLTAFNLIVLMVFFFIFSALIYFPMSHILETSSERDMRIYSKQIQTLYDIPPMKNNQNDKNNRRPPFSYIVILRDPLLDITATNTENTELLLQSINEINRLGENRYGVFSKIKTQESTYRVYTTYSYHFGKRGIVQICQDLRFERNFLNNLFRTLLFIGLISIALLAAISWVMAKKSLKPIKESWEQQKRFIADASHELRTPLTVMKANLEIPLGEKEGNIADHSVWIKNAYDETNNMSNIVNSLLELSKIDSGQIQILKEKIHLSQLVKDTAHRMQPLFNDKSIHLNTEIDDAVYINGDNARINQLLTILLDNALKYTHEGHVKVTLKSHNNRAELVVSDTGIGIYQEDINRIFDRFYRADKTRSRSEGSLGLGLSIAQWIIDEHHGKITVESQDGAGTTFRVILSAA